MKYLKKLFINEIKHRIRIYDPKRITFLMTDCSIRGIGYYLCQKHCNCESTLPDCCDDIWQVTLAGSRFLLRPKERYSSIEGEALGVARALEQTKYFTLGCDSLTVATDHQPLFDIFGDKELKNITNPVVL